jgi:hypothetical protein
MFFLLFSIGLFVDANEVDREAFMGWPVFVVSKTMTNLTLICIAGSFFGGGTFTDCLLRAGIIVAVVLTGGLGAFPEAMLTNTSPQQYGVVAGACFGWSIKTAIENPPPLEFVKGFGFAKKKEGA